MRTVVLSTLLLGSGCVPRLVSPADTDDDTAVCTWEAPTNSWPRREPPACLEGEGFGIGQVVPDFRLMDQNGDTTSLWQFYGTVIVWDLSTIWCRPCQQLASESEDLYDAWRDQGMIYLTILVEDVDGNPPEQDDLQLWASNFGMTTPIVSDADRSYSTPAIPDGSYPVLLVIGRDMRVCQKVTYGEDLGAAIEACL
jgi:peroxiredoxin